MKILINRGSLDKISDTFEIEHQITVWALGMNPGDVVEFYMVMLSEMLKASCVCPPLKPELPAVIGETQLLCCGVPVTLTNERPFVVLDAPQGAKLRAKLITPDDPVTQLVLYEETTTQNVNDRLRGCPCGE